MTISFLDSSAFVKIFVDELASDHLRQQMSTIADPDKALSSVAQVEARSALQRRYRNQEISLNTLRTAVNDLNFVRSRWLLIVMEGAVIETAFDLISRQALRSLDALQLASAIVLREEALATGDDVLFIACDSRLLDAANAEGFVTWNPETSGIPPSPPVN